MIARQRTTADAGQSASRPKRSAVCAVCNTGATARRHFAVERGSLLADLFRWRRRCSQLAGLMEAEGRKGGGARWVKPANCPAAVGPGAARRAVVGISESGDF